ncbi:MAG: AraC family transcriptional regulator [Cyanothece sp. SIO1E1]|nr:AraC family transcriptional regulator [Cyanothece sp. SIO1E1]
MIEDDSEEIVQQKIIPDGFPEIIFHYGDVYRINITGEWVVQPKTLFSGQIRNHFLLENTGSSGMIGIKLKPVAASQCFGINMSSFTDQVVELGIVTQDHFDFISDELISNVPYHQKIDTLNNFFEHIILESSENIDRVKQVIALIFESNGLMTVTDLQDKTGINERKLERLFAKYVGLSPKFYSRIIRFNYIFRKVENTRMSWSELALIAGFYDQSHFIKNFTEFTGEEPSNYFFENQNMGNFHLKHGKESS